MAAARAEWANLSGLRIVSDEIWSDIVYAPYRHVSLASISREDCPQCGDHLRVLKNLLWPGSRGLRDLP